MFCVVYIYFCSCTYYFVLVHLISCPVKLSSDSLASGLIHPSIHSSIYILINQQIIPAPGNHTKSIKFSRKVDLEGGETKVEEKHTKATHRHHHHHYAVPNSLTSVFFPNSANGTMPLTCISGP